MNKNLKISIIMLIVLSFTLVGCGNSVVKKTIDQAKVSIENKEYDKALLSLEMALDEDSNNDEARGLYSIVDGYLKAKKQIEENNFEEAKKNLEGISKVYSNYKIKEDIDELKEQVNKYSEEMDNLTNILKEAEKLYSQNKYAECKVLLYKKILGSVVDEEIEPNIYATQEQKAKAEDLLRKCEQGIMEMDKRKEEEEANKTKQKYLGKLASVEASLSNLDYLYENGTTADLIEAEGTVLKRWDDLLNEIYGELKNQLDKKEMDKLTKIQLDWIKERDRIADQEASLFEGGSFAGVQYNTTLGRITRERCYELVNTYMK